MGHGAGSVGEIIRSVKVYRLLNQKKFPVCEVENRQEMQDKCLELMRFHPAVGSIMPMNHQAVVRQGRNDFTVGERVVHIGALEPAADLFLARISDVDMGRDSRGDFAWITIESLGALFEGPIPGCSVCHMPFLSTEPRNQVEVREGVLIEYCDKCQEVLRDIAAKFAEKKPV